MRRGMALGGGFVIVVGAGLIFQSVLPDSAVAGFSPRTSLQEADESPPLRPLQSFMKQKLTAGNSVLEGLVTDNMLLVEKASADLLKMSAQEEWRASREAMYGQMSREFTANVKEMQAKAEQGSLDGAALSWISVQMQCMKCHEWVRSAIVADKGPSAVDEN